MTSLDKRLDDLEKRMLAKRPIKISVLIFGKDGRVQYGSPELIGKTRAEVEALTGNTTRINVTPQDTDG